MEQIPINLENPLKRMTFPRQISIEIIEIERKLWIEKFFTHYQPREDKPNSNRPNHSTCPLFHLRTTTISSTKDIPILLTPSKTSSKTMTTDKS